MLKKSLSLLFVLPLLSGAAQTFELSVPAKEECNVVCTAADPAGAATLLRLRVYRLAPKFGKSQLLLTFRVNGKEVLPAIPPRRRLLNRSAVNVKSSRRQGDAVSESVGAMFRWKVGGFPKKLAETNTECKEPVWRVWYAEDGKKYNEKQEALLRYVFDISDLVKEGENTISFFNQDDLPAKGAKPELKIHAELETKPGRSALLPEKTQLKKLPVPQRKGYAVTWQSGTEKIFRSSCRAEAVKPEQPSEKLSVAHRRTLKQEKDGTWVIEDTLKNTNAFPVAARLVCHQEVSPELDELAVGGLYYPNCLGIGKKHESPRGKQSVAWRRFKTNPSLFFRTMNGIGVGMILRDADSRNHHAFNEIMPEKKRLGWECGFYKLAPGEAVTLRHEIMFSVGGDYYSFINRVRARWQLNSVTIPHQVCWADLDYLLRTPVEKIRELLTLHKAGAVIVWGGYPWPSRPAKSTTTIFGAPILNDPYCKVMEELAQAGKKVHEADPQVHYLPYMHLTLAGPLTAAERKTYASDLCMLPDGQYWARCWGRKLPEAELLDIGSYSVIPTPGSPYAQAIRKAFFTVREKTGADGFFLDEFGGEFYDYGHDSRFLDLRQGKLVPIRTAGYHGNAVVSALLKEGRKLGMEFWGNGGNLNMQLDDSIDFCPTFSEARLNLWQPRWTVHLNTAAALWYRPRVNTIRMLLSNGVLPVGTALNWNGELTKDLFPITPEKIGPGYVIGREALITAVPLDVPSGFAGKELLLSEVDEKGKISTKRCVLKSGEKLPVPEQGYAIVRNDTGKK